MWNLCHGQALSCLFPISDSKVVLPLDLVNFDLWCLAKVSSNGFLWFVTFIDDCTWLTCVFLWKIRVIVPLFFKNFVPWWLLNFSLEWRFPSLTTKVNMLIKNWIASFVIKVSFTRRLLCLLPQQNCVSEQKNRHILEVACSLVLDKFVPNHYWCHVILAAIYLINHVPSQFWIFRHYFEMLQK